MTGATARQDSKLKARPANQLKARALFGAAACRSPFLLLTPHPRLHTLACAFDPQSTSLYPRKSCVLNVRVSALDRQVERPIRRDELRHAVVALRCCVDSRRRPRADGGYSKNSEPNQLGPGATPLGSGSNVGATCSVESCPDSTAPKLLEGCRVECYDYRVAAETRRPSRKTYLSFSHAPR